MLTKFAFLATEGTDIDLDDSQSKPPAGALRPPAALLALEDAGANSDGRGDGDSGIFKVLAALCCAQAAHPPVFNRRGAA